MTFNFYELHNNQKTSQYTRHTLYLTFSLKTAWYGIIRNYRPSEAALTTLQGGMRNVKVWSQPDTKVIFYQTTLIYA